MTLTRNQVDQLLKPIALSRVLRDGKGHSHVSQQDVLAHLIRVFGFGNFDTEVLDCSLIFEQNALDKRTGQPAADRYDVCYRAMVRLTIRDADGNTVAHYENGSTATAQNQTRGDAHDLAYKSAISLSVKRAAIALGDQFGLSLYNKGQTSPLVIATKVLPHGDTDGADLQSGVPQQVSLGNDEVDLDGEVDLAVAKAQKPPTLADAVEQHRSHTPPAEPAEGTPGAGRPESLRTDSQSVRMFATARELGLANADLKGFINRVVGREVESSKTLTKSECASVIDTLEKAKADKVNPATGEVYVKADEAAAKSDPWETK